MTRIQIKKHLLHRYMNGYQVVDPIYNNIVKELLEKIQKILEKKKDNLIEILKKDLGECNSVTAQIYHQLALKYLQNKSHRTPSIEQLYTIIDGKIYTY